MEFCTRLKIAMNARRKTLSDVSKGCNINKGLISKYLNGKTLPKQKNLYLIAKYLMVSPVYLMGLTDDMEPPQIETSAHIATTKREKLLEATINKLKSLNEEELAKVLKFMEEFL